MASSAAVNRPKQESSVDQKLQNLRQVYAGASELGRAALEKMMPELEVAARLAQTATINGRIGIRSGKVSEFTLMFKLKPGGANRLRTLLGVLGGNFQKADEVGSVHDMRFVIFDNDTRLLFATAYDGEWDPYIVDFSTKIPDELDLLFSELEEFPGFRDPSVKDWIAKYQIPAQSWYVAHPDLTVVEAARQKRVNKAVEEFLDKVG